MQPLHLDHKNAQDKEDNKPQSERFLSTVIFSSRWLQAPLYLRLIDVMMISNLLVMVIIGGYETFVSRLRLKNHSDSPEWLSHVNTNTMKIKLALALIGISSIHLLKTFINIEKIPESAVILQITIHISFLLSVLAIVYTSKLAEKIVYDD